MTAGQWNWGSNRGLQGPLLTLQDWGKPDPVIS